MDIFCHSSFFKPITALVDRSVRGSSRLRPNTNPTTSSILAIRDSIHLFVFPFEEDDR